MIHPVIAKSFLNKKWLGYHHILYNMATKPFDQGHLTLYTLRRALLIHRNTALLRAFVELAMHVNICGPLTAQ